MRTRLVIFHYHYLPGGVSSVVLQAVAAIRECLPEIGDILLVGGRIPEETRRLAARAGARVQELAALDYYAPPGLTGRRVAAEADPLADRLLRQFGADHCLWWVHNHHLGKNPVFTEALLRILRSAPAQRVLLQIHDFPECGRLDNLRLLRRTLGSSPYPTGPNVRYAVLTTRDEQVLLEAGLPADAVRLLENPVPRAALAAQDRLSVRRALMRAFPDHATDLDPQRSLFFYPARTIRRKNVLEAMLLTRLVDTEAALLVTLPGISAPERRYSSLVARGFAAGLCRGLWGKGPQLAAGLGLAAGPGLAAAPERGGGALSFEALPHGSDLVLSTSVQEGFGYLFVNALQWGRPLAARRLPTLAGLAPLLQGYPAHLYDALLCPVRRREAACLRHAYSRKLHRLSSLYDGQTLELLREEIPAVLRGDLVEFSYLSVPQQLEMLRSVARGERLRETRQANADLLGALAGIIATDPAPLAGPVEARFGPEAFARSFGCILASFGEPSGAASASQGEQPVQGRILRRFARLEHLRLLYDF